MPTTPRGSASPTGAAGTSLPSIPARRSVTANVPKTSSSSGSNERPTLVRPPPAGQPRSSKLLDALAEEAPTPTAEDAQKKLPAPEFGVRKHGVGRADVVEDLTLHELALFQRTFEAHQQTTGRGLTPEEFLALVRRLYTEESVSNDEIRLLFLQMDARQQGTVDWDDFVTYMTLHNRAAATYVENQKEAQISKFLTNSRARKFAANIRQRELPSMRHRDNANRIVRVPEREKYISTTRNGLITLWDARTGALQRTLRTANNEWINDAAYAYVKGRTQALDKLIVASHDRMIRVYEMRDGSLREEFPYHVETVPMSLTFWNPGERAIVGYGDDLGALHLLDAHYLAALARMRKPDGSPSGPGPTNAAAEAKLAEEMARAIHLASSKPHTDWITQLRFEPDLRGIVSSSLDNTVKISDPRKGLEITHTIRGHRMGIHCFAWCRSFSVLATCGIERHVKIWTLAGGEKPITHLFGHNASLAGVTMDEHDFEVITLDVDNVVKVWDMRTWKCVQTIDDGLYEADQRISTILYDDASGSLVTAYRMLTVWPSTLPGKTRTKNRSHEDAVVACLFNPTFNLVITMDQAEVRVWNLPHGDPAFSFDCPSEDITAGTLDIDQRRLITGHASGAVRVYNFSTGELLKECINEEGGEITAVAHLFLNAIRYIVGVGWDRKVKLWVDADTQSDLVVQVPLSACYEGHLEDILSMAHCEPGLLASCSYDGLVVLWNTATGAAKHRCYAPSIAALEGHVRSVEKVLFLPHRSQTLVAAGADGYLRFWNPRTGQLLLEMDAGHHWEEAIVSLASDPLNAFLVTGDTNGFVKVWDVSQIRVPDAKAGQAFPLCTTVIELYHWRAHADVVKAIEFIESKRLLMTASDDYTVSLWALDGAHVGVFGQDRLWSLEDRASWLTAEGALIPTRGGGGAPLGVAGSARSARAGRPGSDGRPRWSRSRAGSRGERGDSRGSRRGSGAGLPEGGAAKPAAPAASARGAVGSPRTAAQRRAAARSARGAGPAAAGDGTPDEAHPHADGRSYPSGDGVVPIVPPAASPTPFPAPPPYARSPSPSPAPSSPTPVLAPAPPPRPPPLAEEVDEPPPGAGPERRAAAGRALRASGDKDRDASPFRPRGVYASLPLQPLAPVSRPAPHHPRRTVVRDA